MVGMRCLDTALRKMLFRCPVGRLCSEWRYGRPEKMRRKRATHAAAVQRGAETNCTNSDYSAGNGKQETGGCRPEEKRR